MSIRRRVTIVGASVAGCTAAILYAKEGHSVFIIDRKSLNDYKINCTHFIQPLALPTIKKLDIQEDLEILGATKSNLDIHTPRGCINHSEVFSHAINDVFGYNVQRKLLDPLLKKKMASFDNITFLERFHLKSVERDQYGKHKILIKGDSTELMVESDLLIAADGGDSKIAKITNNNGEVVKSGKFTFFAYFTGIPFKTSKHWVLNNATVYAGALTKQLTLVAFFFNKKEINLWKNNHGIDSKMLDFLGSLEGMPNLDKAKRASDIIWAQNIDNVYRKCYHNEIAFLGDAAMKTDPVSGTGCAFAFKSADLLFECTNNFLHNPGSDIKEGLMEYALKFNAFFRPHFEAISSTSKQEFLRPSDENFYSLVHKNKIIGKAYLKLIYRMISPKEFQNILISNIGLPIE